MLRHAMVAVLVVAGVACAMSDEDLGAMTRTDQDLTRANLLFEGTCDFLRACSSSSRGVAAPDVVWGCEGQGPCSDDEPWVAAPRNGALGVSQTGLCGRRVRFCNGSKCIVAKVRDRSTSSDKFEASEGTMRALGLTAGLTARCTGFGSGRVTIEVLP
jgi:hypothetical protein